MMTKRTRRLGTVVALGAACALSLITAAAGNAAGRIGMVCDPGGPTFNLVANTGYIETPDGNSVFMWSVADSLAKIASAMQPSTGVAPPHAHSHESSD